MSDSRSSHNRIVDELVMVDDDSSSESDDDYNVHVNDSENDDVETGRRRRRIRTESSGKIVTDEETEFREDQSNQIGLNHQPNDDTDDNDDDNDQGDDKKCSGRIIPLSGSIRSRTRSQHERQEHKQRRSSSSVGNSSIRDNINKANAQFHQVQESASSSGTGTSSSIISGFSTPTPSTRVNQEEYNTNLAATMAALSASNKLQQQQQQQQQQEQEQEPQQRHGSILSTVSAIAPSLTAAVTAAPTAATTKKLSWIPPLRQPQQNQNRNVIFNVNDKVLVYLTLLNITNNDELTKDTYTTAAVNKFGYPNKDGKRSSSIEKSDHHHQEKFHGPFMFILCEIKQVHFDESERYYTVHRYDTGIDQRANSGWMEPISDPIAISTALNAAKYGMKNNNDPTTLIINGYDYDDDDDDDGWLIKLQIYWTLTIIPFHQRLRIATKIILTELLHGNRPFSCKIRVTSINLLVLCSTIFLFLEVINLAWLPPKYDNEIAMVGTVVWVILVIELIFEVLIRPSDYGRLVQSDKAYTPSTARFISQMYIIGEAVALATFIPEIGCLQDTDNVCSNRSLFGPLNQVRATVLAVLGPSRFKSLYGRFFMGLMALRFFGVVRHWKQMLINQTFHPTKREGLEKWVIPYDPKRWGNKKLDDDDESIHDDLGISTNMTDSQENHRLKNAANIGTALIVVNCQRALVLMTASVLILPLFFGLNHQNMVSDNLTGVLQANNLASVTGFRDCEYLQNAIESWLNIAIVDQPGTTSIIQPKGGIERNETYTYVLWAQVLPVRCPFQNETGTITSCTDNNNFTADHPATCNTWNTLQPNASIIATTIDNDKRGAYDPIGNYFAQKLGLRSGGIVTRTSPIVPNSYQFEALNEFKVTVVYNQNPTIATANKYEFLLLLCIFILGLSFLVIIQNDVNRLALTPIKRMLRIVVRYAQDPLSIYVNDDKITKGLVTKENNNDGGCDYTNTPAAANDIGNIETEQLLNAITKISDLLRKCWGVAGGGIISSNLARTKDGKVAVFNPTVPGKQVYALFAFVGIGGYSQLLRDLDRDVMILINDIASVVHDEIYRWALGEHGQCNKNNGPSFLMVWRIGDFIEVQKKNKEAIEKMFRDKVYKTSNKNHHHNSSNLRRRNNNRHHRVPYSSRPPKSKTTRMHSSSSTNSSSQDIQLESLPGIQDFTDRALLGMLKSFAGIHRDKSLQDWKNDFRLSAGVSAFEYTVDVFYGMDAGWAVEGAVGSEYKIDATYLSPHVNMASRMMSASKQYDSTILLSKAVEKLLSKNCRKKLRHLDTVYVKGSHIKQSIYTYDARFRGVDFFLLERTPKQADKEAENCTSSIWNRDQDVLAMRQHISQDFLDTYHFAVKQYLGGKWSEAYKTFKKADNIMIRTVVEEGYIEIIDMDQDDLERRIYDEDDQREDIVKIRREFGDGACRTLMNYIERRNFSAPDDWDAVRQLFSK